MAFGIDDIFVGAMNYNAKMETNQANLRFAREQFEYQKELDQRNFDWTKHVTQEQWNREDNAVQRRAADMAAAGINPNLAAGSAAAAGSGMSAPASHAQTSYHADAPQMMPIGNLFDAVKAVQEIKIGQQKVEQEKLRTRLLDNEQMVDAFDSDLKINQILYLLGKTDDGESYPALDEWRSNTKLREYVNNRMKQEYEQRGQAFPKELEALENTVNKGGKDLQYYDTDKILDYVSSVLGDVGDLKGLLQTSKKSPGTGGLLGSMLLRLLLR